MSDFTDNPFGDLVMPDDLFGKATNELAKTQPNLFTPRSVAEYKNDLLDRGKQLSDDQDITEFDVLIEDMSTVHAERMNRLLGEMSDSSFAQSYMRLLSYIKPKLKAVEADPQTPVELTQINVTVINSKNEIHNYNESNTN